MDDGCFVDRMLAYHRNSKEITLFEVACPGMTQLDSANRRKADKYKHFERDISSFKVEVVPFEVEAATGHINNNRNKQNIKNLHKFVRKGTSLKLFTKQERLWKAHRARSTP